MPTIDPPYRLDPLQTIIDVYWSPPPGELGPAQVSIGIDIYLVWALGQVTGAIGASEARVYPPTGLGEAPVSGTITGNEGANYPGQPAGRVGAMSFLSVSGGLNPAWVIRDEPGNEFNFDASFGLSFVSSTGRSYSPSGSTSPAPDGAGSNLHYRYMIILNRALG